MEEILTNEDLKLALQRQGGRIRTVTQAYDTAKSALENFNANTWAAGRADGVKRTESDLDAYVRLAKGHAELESALIAAKADLDAVKTEIQCLLSQVALTCSEIAAASRIAGT